MVPLRNFLISSSSQISLFLIILASTGVIPYSFAILLKSAFFAATIHFAINYPTIKGVLTIDTERLPYYTILSFPYCALAGNTLRSTSHNAPATHTEE